MLMNASQNAISKHRALTITLISTLNLYHPSSTVTSVAASADLDLVASGSSDSTVIIHNLRDGAYVRSITISTLTQLMPAGSESNISKAFNPTPSGTAASTVSNTDANTIFSADSTSTGGAGSSNTIVAGSGSSRNISWVGISSESYIITYAHDDLTICTYGINGTYIK